MNKTPNDTLSQIVKVTMRGEVEHYRYNGKILVEVFAEHVARHLIRRSAGIVPARSLAFVAKNNVKKRTWLMNRGGVDIAEMTTAGFHDILEREPLMNVYVEEVVIYNPARALVHARQPEPKADNLNTSELAALLRPNAWAKSSKKQEPAKKPALTPTPEDLSHAHRPVAELVRRRYGSGTVYLTRLDCTESEVVGLVAVICDLGLSHDIRSYRVRELLAKYPS